MKEFSIGDTVEFLHKVPMTEDSVWMTGEIRRTYGIGNSQFMYSVFNDDLEIMELCSYEQIRYVEHHDMPYYVQSLELL